MKPRFHKRRVRRGIRLAFKNLRRHRDRNGGDLGDTVREYRASCFAFQDLGPRPHL